MDLRLLGLRLVIGRVDGLEFVERVPGGVADGGHVVVEPCADLHDGLPGVEPREGLEGVDAPGRDGVGEARDERGDDATVTRCHERRHRRAFQHRVGAVKQSHEDPPRLRGPEFP